MFLTYQPESYTSNFVVGMDITVPTTFYFINMFINMITKSQDRTPSWLKLWQIVGYKVHLSRAPVDIKTHCMSDLLTHVKHGKGMRSSPIPSEVAVSFNQFHSSTAKPNLTLIKIILDNDTDEITGLLARASCDSSGPQDYCWIYIHNVCIYIYIS